MQLALSIARRYLFSKKSTRAINIISLITATAMAVGTAALIIVMSVFNGFEDLIKSLYKVFYPDVLILPAEGKFFSPDENLENILKNTPGIVSYSAVLQENVLAEHNGQQYIATVKGVDSNYLKVASDLKDYLYQGALDFGDREVAYAVMGIGVAYALGINVNQPTVPLTLYMPRKDKKSLSDVANAFRRKDVIPGATFAVQQDFDAQLILLPLDAVFELMGDEKSISAIEIKTQKGQEDKVRDAIAQSLAQSFTVKNRYQQNETLYKVMQTEKWVVFALLSFIMLIAAFNIIGSLSMLVLEKQKDISTLMALGASKSLIQKIFVLEGMMMSLLGAGTGMLISLIVCMVQQYIGVIKMPGESFVIQYYPVKVMWQDFLLIFLIVFVISAAMSWIPAKRAAATRDVFLM